MNLYINDKKMPVTWFDNESVTELKKDVSQNVISVQLSMYGGNEQFGSLGKTYVSNDKNIATECGDIVLYNSDSIVLFYGSNTWEYTSLGKINLSNKEVIDLLSNGDITIELRPE